MILESEMSLIKVLLKTKMILIKIVAKSDTKEQHSKAWNICMYTNKNPWPRVINCDKMTATSHKLIRNRNKIPVSILCKSNKVCIAGDLDFWYQMMKPTRNPDKMRKTQ